jgi:DNA-binding NarL/FixJ family response regulator
MKPHLGMLEKHSERIAALESTVSTASADSNGAMNPDGLSDREVEVLRLIAAGHSNQKIADELFLSRYTIVRHVANIFAKTSVANRTEAATYANQSGLMEEPAGD